MAPGGAESLSPALVLGPRTLREAHPGRQLPPTVILAFKPLVSAHLHLKPASRVLPGVHHQPTSSEQKGLLSLWPAQ